MATIRVDDDLKKLMRRRTAIEKLSEAMDLLIHEVKLGQEYNLHPLEPKTHVPKRWEIHVGKK
ncbi:type II toxin-antitoxin system YafQ family toxin [Enterococcus canintestini]|uniref:type II toxin-antitoxin system YafQ family toxin n=1 Tax=Enterococcus canintestini TaxID=317010 RepID=UPI000BA23166|nr:type II toxin-antitoxin system YafQ family toxin [Enterococcus canintestini]